MLDSRDDSALHGCRSELCRHMTVSIWFCGTRQCLLTGQGHLGLRVLTPTSPKKNKTKQTTTKKTYMAPINQSTATDKLSFIREVWSNVCVSKNQYLVSDVCTAEPRVHLLTACLLYFPAVLHQMPWFVYKSYTMQRCWPFEWDSQIFFFTC